MQWMRIAFVYDAVYPFVKGGVEKRIFLLARALAKKHEVHVFGMKYWSGSSVRKEEGVVYHGVCRPLCLYIRGRRSLLQPFYFSFFLVRELFRWDFDVVDCQNFPYIPAFVCKAYSLVRQKSLVITWSEYWVGYWKEYLGWLGRVGGIIERGILFLADHHVAVSSFTAGRLPRKSALVENGVDVAEMQSIRMANERYDIVYFGRLIKEKNVHLLLGALAKLPRVSCCVIGDGPEKQGLKVYAARLELGERVRFFGFVQEKKLFSIVKGAKVVVLPSMREGFGISALEGFACGRSVITLRGNGTGDVVRDGVNGVLAGPSAAAFAEKIRGVLEDGVFRRQLEKGALRTAWEFDIDKITRKMECYYQSVL